MNSTKYMQTDSKWGSLPYPKKPCTIRNDGCGEVAVANVIIEMQKYANYTPATIQPYCKQFAAPSCDGTYWSGIPTMMKHYGLTEVKECATMPALWTELAKGNRVAILLMGSRNGGSKKIHWSGSGHFIAVVGYRYKDGDHQVYVKDSYSNLSSRNGWLGYKTHLQGDVLKVWSGKLNGTLATASATPTTTTTTTTTTATKLVVDGIGGTATIKAAQKYFGTVQDGVISGQNKSYKGYYPSIHAVQFGKGGSSLVVAIQKWCGLSGPDGIIGKNTTRGWQTKLRSLGYLPKNETIDGIFGVKSMKAFQNFLNDRLYPSKTSTTTTTTTTTTKPTTSTTTPTTSSTTVIDVSAFQDAIDWAKVKASGVKGAIVRCGYRGYESGKLNKDSMFENHYKGASKAGLNVGVYFFTEAINATEGKEEADYAIKLVESTGIKPYYPVVIDTEAQSAKTERAKNLTKAQRTEVIKAFCEEVKAKGYEPMIYASTSWLNNKLDMSKLPYKVWCAQYYTKCEYKGTYVMWQYTSSGKVNGIKGNVDMSHCYLTSASPSPSVAPPTKKSVDELAKEVLDGKWGSGQTRKDKLTAAGYNYDEVQKKVNEILAAQTTVADKLVVEAKELAWAKGTATSKYKYPSGSATNAFKTALDKVYPEHTKWGAAPSVGASCDVFVGTCVRASGLDSKYERGLEEQLSYKSSAFDRYEYKSVKPIDKAKYGDIVMFTYNGGAHTVILGDGCYYEANYQTYFGHVNTSLDRLKKSYGKVVILRPKAVTTTVIKKTIDELAKEVIDGKWSSGATRKAKLTEAGYDYDAVQKRVNELLEPTDAVSKMNAWARRISAEKYHYVKWEAKVAKTHTCPICENRRFDDAFGWNCIGFAWACWHHGGGLKNVCDCGVISNEIADKILKGSDAEALSLVRSHCGLNDVKVVKNGGKAVPLSMLKAGDIILFFKDSTYYHTAYYMGDGKYSESNTTGGIGSADNIRADLTLSATAKANLKVAIRYIGGTPSVTVKKSVDQLAQEVLDGKWGSGETRKKKLTEAGYDYDAVQKRVNEIIESQQTMADKIIAACKTQAEWMKNFKYEWENKPTIEKSKKKGTCVTYVACVLQRVGLLKSGEHIWHNGSGFGTGKVTGNTKNFDVMYMDNKTFTALKSKLKKGDVVLCDDNKSGEKGSGGHIMIFSGQWASNGNPLVYDQNSATYAKNGKSLLRSYPKSHKILAICRAK